MNREESERYLIGMLLFDKYNLNIDGLNTTLFKNERYKVILEALLIIYKENFNYLDNITLINYLKMTDKLDFVGGEPEIVGLQDTIPEIGTYKQLTKIIKQLKFSRP